MVVRNGIILIDYARELKENQGMTTKDAAIAAGKRRMRPIFLTSAAAAVGVIPMILSRSPLWGPLGTVICFGLLFSMVLTLYILPVLYSLSYGENEKKFLFWRMPGNVKMSVIILMVMVPLLLSTSQAQTISLDSCKKLALQNNRRIKDAELQLQASQQQKQEVLTQFFPKVSVSAFALRSADYLMKLETPQMNLPVWDGKDPRQLLNPTQFAYFPALSIGLLDYMNTAAVTVAMPVYAGGRIRRGYKLAKLGEEVNVYRKAMTREEVLSRAEDLFWTLQSLSQKEMTLKSYKLLLDSLYRDVNNYSNAGLAQQNDVLKVHLKQNELKINSLKLKNGINITKRALCQHIGLVYDSSLCFTAPLDSQFAFLVFQEPEQMVKNRNEYLLLNKAVEVKQVQKKLAIGEFLPQLSLVGAGLTYDIMNKTTNNALGMINLNIPITDWWAGSHKIKRQQIEVEQAESSLQENTEMLVLQIRQAADEVEETHYQIEVSKVSVEQAMENLRISQDQYKAGLIGISDLLEAEAIVQQAKDNLIDAHCQFRIKLAKYKLMTGG